MAANACPATFSTASIRPLPQLLVDELVIPGFDWPQIAAILDFEISIWPRFSNEAPEEKSIMILGLKQLWIAKESPIANHYRFSST